MPLQLKSIIDSGFTEKKRSDFTLICKGEKFRVHTLVLEQYAYFAALLKGCWTEAQTRMFRTDEDDPSHFRALVKYMYGADIKSIMACCNPSAAAIRMYAPPHLPPLAPYLQGDDERRLQQWLKDLQDEGVSGGPPTFQYWSNRADKARIAADVTRQILQIYVLADKYELSDLKYTMLDVLQNWIQDSWDHSDIVEVIEMVFTNLRDEDSLRRWLYSEIETRFDMLRNEPKFKNALLSIPNLAAELCTSEMTPLKAKITRYCRARNRTCCRNVEIVKGKHYEKCKQCGNRGYLVERKIRIWEDEDVEEPGSKRVRSS